VLLGLVHRGAAQIGMDEDTRRALQQRVTGHDSCRDMTDAELLAVIRELRRLGADVRAPVPMADGRPGMASGWQLATLEHLALDMGWKQGLDDARFVAFIARTAGVQRAQWLDRAAASKAITGLRRWKWQRGKTT
jgi:hypothetical protein